MTNSKYLVRPDDSMIWVFLEEFQLYGMLNGPRCVDGTISKPHDHMTFENLTQNYGFFPITEEEIPHYQAKCDKYFKDFAEEARQNHGCG